MEDSVVFVCQECYTAFFINELSIRKEIGLNVLECPNCNKSCFSLYSK